VTKVHLIYRRRYAGVLFFLVHCTRADFSTLRQAKQGLDTLSLL
jgi:hypothetical protein